MRSESRNTTGSAAAVWDFSASSYEASRAADPIYSSCVRLAMREIPEETPLCLDAGCGTGLLAMRLGARCGTVVAVDYSRESLKILKRKGLQNVIPVQADVTSLPFRDAVFDGCVCANTLQHLRPDGAQGRAVAELGRVTKENGVISVSVHHYSRGKRKAGWIKEGKPGQPGIDYIFRFTRNELLMLFPGSKTRGIGYYGWMRIPLFGSRLQDVLGIVLGRIAALLGYGHMLTAVTRKRSEGMTTT
ncbi:MAG: class I SAM-dependent methyltransferase [Gammaproteobacteria bacterium]